MANPIETINNVSNFVRSKGKTETIDVIFTASVAAEEGSAVYPDPVNAGQYTIVDATAGNNFGVIRQTIATTDSDFASTKTVKVEFPRDNNVEFYFTVGAGVFTAADENKYADFNDGKTISVDTALAKQVFITKYISATRGKMIFAGNLGAGLAAPVTT